MKDDEKSEKIVKELQDQQIYEEVTNKSQIPNFELSWSHYQMLIRIEDKNERSIYEIEAAKNQVSLQKLKR